MGRKTTAQMQEFWEVAKTLAAAVVIAILIRAFAYEPFNIPSASMVPTLLVGDYLFVSKAAYGYSRYSLPWGIFPFEGRVFESAPQRGDVVVFREPADTSVDFIKRLIGLPGDRIQMIDGVLHINGEAVKLQQIEDYVDPEDSYVLPAPQYIETLPGGVSHRIIERSGARGPFDNTPVYVVPPDHYFMMGDNRDQSNDSRVFRDGVWLTPQDTVTDGALLNPVGFVPKENLIGPARILFWSHAKSLRFYNPLSWIKGIRWRRFFDFVQ